MVCLSAVTQNTSMSRIRHRESRGTNLRAACIFQDFRYMAFHYNIQISPTCYPVAGNLQM